jgi:hypothetical protein
VNKILNNDFTFVTMHTARLQEFASGKREMSLQEVRNDLVNLLNDIDNWSPAVKIDADKLFKHNKRGGVYEVIAETMLQVADGRTLGDGTPIYVYKGSDGQYWVRAVDEFNDGRFTKV